MDFERVFGLIKVIKFSMLDLRQNHLCKFLILFIELLIQIGSFQRVSKWLRMYPFHRSALKPIIVPSDLGLWIESKPHIGSRLRWTLLHF